LNLVKTRLALHEVARCSMQFVQPLGAGQRFGIFLRPGELSADLGASVCVCVRP
jgi:hypothetical protein